MSQGTRRAALGRRPRAGEDRRQRVTAAVAMLALLSHLVFPMHAVMAASQPARDGFMPICTSKGIVWVKLDPNAPEPPGEVPSEIPGEAPADTSFGQPCHFCTSQTKKIALPSAGPKIKMWLATGVEHPSCGVTARSRAVQGPNGIRAPPA